MLVILLLTTVLLTRARAQDYCNGDIRNLGQQSFQIQYLVDHVRDDEDVHSNKIPTNITNPSVYEQISTSIYARARFLNRNTEACDVGHREKQVTDGVEATWYSEKAYDNGNSTTDPHSNWRPDSCQTSRLVKIQDIEQAVEACASDMNACDATAACCTLQWLWQYNFTLNPDPIEDERFYAWGLKLKLSTQPNKYPSFSLQCPDWYDINQANDTLKI